MQQSQGKFGKGDSEDVYLQKSNNQNDKGTKGESALRRLLGEHEEGERIYQTIAEASGNTRRSSRMATQDRSGGWDKQSFLRSLSGAAKRNGTWSEKIEDIQNAGKFIKSGFEQEVYLSKDVQSVIKVNKLALLDADDSGIHTTDFNSFIDRLLSHNESIGHNVPYKIIGFTENSKEETSVVLEQSYIRNARYAPLRTIYEWLRDYGFKPKTLTNGVQGFSNGKYEVSDVKPENVLQDKNETLYFIDTEINSQYVKY